MCGEGGLEGELERVGKIELVKTIHKTDTLTHPSSIG